MRPSPSSRPAARLVRRMAAALLALALLPLAASPPPARAAGGILVNSPSGLIADDGDAGTCTLFEAVQAANTNQAYGGCPGGTQAGELIPDGIVFASPYTIKLEGRVFINTPIAITGPVTIAMNPSADTGQFQVTSNGKLFLTNLTMRDAEASAVLIFGGELNVAGALFTDNTALNAGGAINNGGGTVRVAGTAFVANKVPQDGGAIWSSGAGDLLIGGSIFTGNAAGYNGGAIYNSNSQSSTEIADTIFAGNQAEGDSEQTNNVGGGGAIYNTTADDDDPAWGMTIVRSTFDGNLAPRSDGGAIYNQGVLRLRDSSLNGNLAGTPPSTARTGAAIFNSGALTVQRATLLNNAVVGDGGGISNNRGGTATLGNVLLYANAATGYGAGLANLNTQQGSNVRPSASLRNVTVANNASATDGGGGGLYGQPGGELRLANTIVAGSDGPLLGGNCGGATISEGHNLDSGASCALSGAGDLSGTNPNLDAPMFNGGPLASLLSAKLLAGSPAIDAGDDAVCAAEPVANVDQRGEARGVDGDEAPGGACDMGAVESAAAVAGFGSDPVAPGPISLGSAVAGQGSTSATISVFETGNRTLSLSEPQLGGPNAAEFGFSGLPATIANGGAAQTVTVTCAPAAVGARTAILTFSTNDPVAPTVSFSLLCVGTAQPAPGFGSDPQPPGPVTVGETVIGLFRTARIELIESGTAALTVSDPQISGDNAADFGVAGLPATIADGAASQEIVVTCIPSGGGARSATLQLATNDPSRPTVSFALSCEGVQAPTPPLAEPGVTVAPGIVGPTGMAIGPGGAQLYVAASPSVRAYTRNPATGALSLAGTLTNGQISGGETVEGLLLAQGMALSPDGKNLYVAGAGDSAAVALARDPETGQLTFIDAVQEGDCRTLIIIPNPCSSPVSGLDGAYDVAVSADGRFVYLSGEDDNALTVFTRRASDGALRGVLNLASQVQSAQPLGLVAPRGIVLSPDGAHLYAASSGSGTVAAFKRSGVDGTLSAPAFVSDSSLAGVSDLAISADGQFVYAAASAADSLVVLRRDAASGALTVETSYTDGFRVDGLDGVSDLALSADGRLLYASGFAEDKLAIFGRDSVTGRLRLLQVVASPADVTLDGPRGLAPSADGRHLYAGGFFSSNIARLDAANPTPLALALGPASAPAGPAGLALTVEGAGFVPGSEVRWNGAARPTSFVNSTRLTAQIAAGDLAATGQAAVTVFNPSPGGGASNALSFTITAPDENPVPALSELQPAGAQAGAGGLTVVIRGSGFLPSSKARWNGAERTTLYQSAAYLELLLTPADLAAPGDAVVTVQNPGPGGGASNGLIFSVAGPGENAPPAISSLSPGSLAVGGLSGASLTLSVYGSGFVPGAVVTWDGAERPTTFVSAGELRAAIGAADVGEAGFAEVRAVNPAPGGGPSNALSFTVVGPGENPLPTAVSFAISGGSLELSGAGFVAGAVVRWNGADLPTTVLGPTALRATLPAGAVATPASVVVVNPGPGGGASNELFYAPRRMALPALRR